MPHEMQSPPGGNLTGGGGAVNTQAGGLRPYDSTASAKTQDILTRNQARAALQDLLAGGAPSQDPGQLGAWAETYQSLADAHAAGGVAAVRRVFDALAKANPMLGFLVGTDPDSPKTEWTTAELLAASFPAPKWAVPGLVPVGLSILAGRPKLGKSWLALQIAIAVGTGGKALDQDVSKGKALFLALEDSPRRLKERLLKQSAPASAAVTFRTDWPALGDGGIGDLANAVQSGGFSFVVIDTFSRAVGRADQQDLADMTMLLGDLQRLAMVLDVAVLLVDHHRKAGAMGASAVDDVMGSTGKAAVADAILGLYKEQGKKGATLAVTGRDLDEKELALEWDGLTACWQSLGDAGEVLKDSVKGDVIDAVKALVEMGQTPTTDRIASHADRHKGTVSHAVHDLVTAGKLVRGAKQGREQPYYLPGQVANDP